MTMLFEEWQQLVEAIQAHEQTKAALDAARKEHDAARAALVTLLHEHGVVGFSL